MEQPQHIVIVGAGECGAHTAIGLRSNGYQGSLTLVGDEVDAPYERPPLSKRMLTDEMPTGVATVLTAERAAELSIDMPLGIGVVSVNRQQRFVALQSGTTLPYDRLVLTTGASARVLAIPGGDLATTLRTRSDCERIRKAIESYDLPQPIRVLIIGGGFIGLEVAASCSARGAAVTVLEVAPRVMGRAVPEAVAGEVERSHRQHDVDVRCHVGVDGLTRDDGGSITALLSEGTRLTADFVIAGVGAVPNTQLAAGAGLAIDNGIAVDAKLRTDDPNIFAAGDCCSFPHPLFHDRRIRVEAWRNALDQASVVARNLLGANETYCAVPWFWSDQFDFSIQVAGWPPCASQEIVRTRTDGYELRFGLDEEGRLVSAAGVAIGNTIAKDIRLAEMLIAKRCTPTQAQLADASISLKSLLSLISA